MPSCCKHTSPPGHCAGCTVAQEHDSSWAGKSSNRPGSRQGCPWWWWWWWGGVINLCVIHMVLCWNGVPMRGCQAPNQYISLRPTSGATNQCHPLRNQAVLDGPQQQHSSGCHKCPHRTTSTGDTLRPQASRCQLTLGSDTTTEEDGLCRQPGQQQATVEIGSVLD